MSEDLKKEYTPPKLTQLELHPAVADILQHFSYEHLPPNLQEVSRPICEMAAVFAAKLKGPELTVGLRKLLEAKDCLVRAALPPKPRTPHDH